MTKSDFEGIEPGDWILIDGRTGQFEKLSNDWGSETVFWTGVGGGWAIDQIKSISVLQGKLAPWSSPYVPDWANFCTEDKTTGSISFHANEPMFKSQTIAIESNNFIVSRRPTWRKPNVRP